MAKDEIGSEAKSSPPYIAFSTLKTLTSNLKAHGLPPRIDKSIMSNFSGAVAGQLMTALRFLALIDANEAPTSRFKLLIDSYDTADWPKQLRAVLENAYPEIFKIDLATASPKLLYDTFQASYAGAGETVRKTVTFFLNAATDAQVSVSPYILKNKKPRGASAKRRPNGKPVRIPRGRQENDLQDNDRITPPRQERSPYEVLMHDIYDPTSMGPDEERAVFTLARFLKKREAT